MTEMSAVDVTIMGREFTVACTEDERAGLMTAVHYLDKKMCEIRDTGKVVSVERIAVMAALNLAHEVLNASSGGLDIGQLKRRILSMQEHIDEVVAEA